MGFSEFLLILIVALIFIGPKQLPAITYQAGKWFAKWKSFVGEVKNEVDHHAKLEQLKQNTLRAEQAESARNTESVETITSKADTSS